MATKSDPITIERCSKRLLERGLTLRTCSGSGGIEASVYSGPGKSGRKLGSVVASKVGGKLKVEGSFMDPSIRKSGVGTLLYEAVVAHGCEVGMPIRSDDTRSSFAEAFWRKQHLNRRVKCVKGRKTWERGFENPKPKNDLRQALARGQITKKQFDATVARLPKSENDYWPCYYYEITNPCRTRTLAGR